MNTLHQQRWKMLLLTMFCYLFFYMGRHNFGWAAKQLAVDLEISFERIGWISFAMLIGYAVGQLVHGNLADRVSPKHLILTGGLLSAAANIAISFSTSFTVILILWTLNGYFQSMAWASGSRIIANWWKDGNRGMAFGMYTMAAGTSSILTYLSSILLMGEGWRNIFRIPVLFLAVAAIIFFLLVKNKPDETETTKEENDTEQKPSWQMAYRYVFSNKKFLIVCLSLGFQSMARYGLIFWIPLYFQSQSHGDDSTKIWISLLLPIGMAAGAISFGFISDRLFQANRVKSIILGMSCCAVVSLALYLVPVHQIWATCVFVFLAGFFAYGPQANFWPLSPEILGHAYVGTGVGIMNMCAYIFAALGEPVMGRLIDATGEKGIIFITVSVIALLSAITISCIRLFRTGKSSQQIITSIN